MADTRGATLITSNRASGDWDEVFGYAIVATAILERLLHHSVVLTICGTAQGSARAAKSWAQEVHGQMREIKTHVAST